MQNMQNLNMALFFCIVVRQRDSLPRQLPTIPDDSMLNLRYQELGQVRNMDKKRIQLPFLSAHFAELSWSKDTTI